MSFTNKKIVVTGAASGIGAETAKLLKSQGAQVIAVDLNQPSANADQYIKADLADPLSIGRAIEALPAGIDGLCNIAGVPPTRGRSLVLKVNFLGLRQFTQQLIGKLNDNAAIVNLASMAGHGWTKAVPRVKALLALEDFEAVEDFCREHSIDDVYSYLFSKEALIVWTMINRWTWRKQGIRMNCVSPGPVETPILPDFIKMLGERAQEDMTLLGRAGTPQEVAPLVVFLCSDGSRWISGANIPCDGGMNQHVLCKTYGLE